MAKTSHELAIEFAVEITELSSKIKGRPEYTKQLIRSASSISANIAEAKYAGGKKDFCHKLRISLKEINEVEFWLESLYMAGSITQREYSSMRSDAIAIRRMLSASIRKLESKD